MNSTQPQASALQNQRLLQEAQASITEHVNEFLAVGWASSPIETLCELLNGYISPEQDETVVVNRRLANMVYDTTRLIVLIANLYEDWQRAEGLRQRMEKEVSHE